MEKTKKRKLSRFYYWQHHGEDNTLTVAHGKDVRQFAKTFTCIRFEDLNRNHRLFKR